MWKAKLKNGEEVSELTRPWNDVKTQICELLYMNGQQVISLPPNQAEYIQFKTASSVMGANNIEIESQTIGFKIDNKTFKIKIDKKTSNITLEFK